jgi:hypothetical protein
MAFAADDMVNYKGKAFSREMLWHKVKSIGWSAAQFGRLTDEQITQVMDQRLTPDKVAIVETVNDGPVDLEKLGEDPSIMGATPPPPGVEEVSPPVQPMPRPAVPVRLSGVVDPTKPAIRPVGQPTPATPTFRPTPATHINVRPPRTQPGRLLPILDAAYQLAQSETTVATARSLLQSNKLERAFQSLYPDHATKVLGRIDTTPDLLCQGGVILDVEINTEDGYAHIVTTSGIITLEGNGLKQTTNEPKGT